MSILIKTKIPGPNSRVVLKKLERLNGAWVTKYPFVYSKNGKGCYFKDLDDNTFLDFASLIASNPLGYNHSEHLKVIKKYKQRTPIKYAGADFAVEEQVNLLEELLSITPKKLNAAFLINSGAEAVENCMKIAMRLRPHAKTCISFQGAFHGRTLGALSLTNSNSIQKKGFFTIPTERLPFSEEAPEKLERILKQEVTPEDIAFVILEHVQGEGGYRVPDKNMVTKVHRICQRKKIPYIADEVQAGMGRTGKWWAFQHFGIEPDIMSSAKALGVGAAITNKKNFPEPGAISSTWGGGHIIDMAMGVATIRTIKKDGLLSKNLKHGEYLRKRLREISEQNKMYNVRGLGLMTGFDVCDGNVRKSFVQQCLKNGLILMGAGEKSIRIIPPYVVTTKEIDEALSIIEYSIKICNRVKR